VKGYRAWSTAPRSLYSDGKCFSVVGIDIVKGSGAGEFTILTLTDLYSRYVFAWDISNETSAAIIKPLGKLFLQEGPPRIVVCDNGPCFISAEFKAFVSKWSIGVKYIPRYSGHYAGFYEKSHHILIQTLIICIEEALGADWRKLLPLAVMSMNLRPFEFQVNGKSLSPFEVFKGREISELSVPAPLEDPRPTDEQVCDNLDTLGVELFEMREKFEEIWKSLLEKSFRTIAKRYKPTDTLKAGELVLRWVPDTSRRKLENRWEGPFKIERTISDVIVLIDGKEEHVYNLKRFVQNVDNSKKRKIVFEEEPFSKKSRVASVLKPRGMLLWL